MATTYKLLGQVNPGTTWTSVAGSANTNVLSTLVVCNTSASSKQFRVAVVNGSGTTPTTANCLSYDTSVPANDTVTLTLGITLGTSYYCKVYGSTTDVTFSAFGCEIT
jgi:hypothetical protein